MIIWRLARTRVIKDFSGQGAKIFGGRWNRIGLPLLYTTSSLSGSVLHILANSGSNLSDWSFVPILIPDDILIERLDESSLPEDWFRFNKTSDTQSKLFDLVENWISAKKSAVLEIPDEIIPYERQYLIYPLHPDFFRIEVGEPERFYFDNRIRGELFREFFDKKEDNVVREFYKEPNKYLYSKGKGWSKANVFFMKDAFISHASEDKISIVNPLIEALEKEDISFWYDQREIAWGDSIVEKINEGMRLSKYVIVILSINFIKKYWTKKEFNAAMSIEVSLGQKKVLPLVVGTVSEVNAIKEEFTLISDKLYMMWDPSPDKIKDLVLKLKLLL